MTLTSWFEEIATVKPDSSGDACLPGDAVRNHSFFCNCAWKSQSVFLRKERLHSWSSCLSSFNFFLIFFRLPSKWLPLICLSVRVNPLALHKEWNSVNDIVGTKVAEGRMHILTHQDRMRLVSRVVHQRPTTKSHCNNEWHNSFVLAYDAEPIEKADALEFFSI